MGYCRKNGTERSIKGGSDCSRPPLRTPLPATHSHVIIAPSDRAVQSLKTWRRLQPDQLSCSHTDDSSQSPSSPRIFKLGRVATIRVGRNEPPALLEASLAACVLTHPVPMAVLLAPSSKHERVDSSVLHERWSATDQTRVSDYTDQSNWPGLVKGTPILADARMQPW